jgi:hypothetical protein
VDTRDENRDNHLRTDDFFDVPTTRSGPSSARRSPRRPTEWKVDGDLTIRGVTKPVTLDVTLEGVVKDPTEITASGSAPRPPSTATTSCVFRAVMEAGGLVVAKKVDIEIELEAVLQS